MLSTAQIPRDNINRLQATSNMWDRQPTTEIQFEDLLGTYLSLPTNCKGGKYIPFGEEFCKDDLCVSDTEPYDPECEDDESEDNGFVKPLEPAVEDIGFMPETKPAYHEQEISLETSRQELELSENVRANALNSLAKNKKKTKNQKVIDQKAKAFTPTKYTQAPVEDEAKKAQDQSKRVSKTVKYAVPCGAFTLRSGKSHGKALKPSRILLDQVREEERKRKRLAKQANAKNARSSPAEPEEVETLFVQESSEEREPQVITSSPQEDCGGVSHSVSTRLSENNDPNEDFEMRSQAEESSPESESANGGFREEKQSRSDSLMAEEFVLTQESSAADYFLVKEWKSSPQMELEEWE